MKRIGKYLRVGKSDDSPKLLEIINNDDLALGVIQYKNTWRQYIFWPDQDVEFNHRCLTDIAAYLMTMNKTKGTYKVKP